MPYPKHSLSRMLAALLLMAVLVGCGPVTSSSAITEAEIALKDAEEVEAHRFAAFTYWSAVNYLEKAKQIQGYSLFEGSSDYALRSMELALRSVEETKEFHHQEKLRRERLKTGAKRKNKKKSKKKGSSKKPKGANSP